MTTNRSQFINTVIEYWGPVNSKRTSEEYIFQDWILNSFTLWMETKAPSSFAPYNAYFSTQDSFIENMLKFIDNVLNGQMIGQVDARIALRRNLEILLSESTDSFSPYLLQNSRAESEEFLRDAKATYLGDLIFDIFEIMLHLSSNSACEWAARSIQSPGGLSNKTNSSGTPAPLALYISVPQDDTSSESKASFYSALFDWAYNNSGEPELRSSLIEILELRLRSIYGANRAEQTIAVFENRFNKPSSNSAVSLLYLVELIIVRRQVNSNSDLFVKYGQRIANWIQAGTNTLVREFSVSKKQEWKDSPFLYAIFSDALDVSIMPDTTNIRTLAWRENSMLGSMGAI